MPIKAKRIDPSKALRAARGQWRKPSPFGTEPQRERSRSSSGTSSEDSEDNSARRRIAERQKSPGPPAFLTHISEAEEDDSDPELYRAARERTARFLYPNGRGQGAVATVNCSGDALASQQGTSATRESTAARSHRPAKKESECGAEAIPLDIVEEDTGLLLKKEGGSVSGTEREPRQSAAADDDTFSASDEESAAREKIALPPAAVRAALAPAVEAEDFRRLLKLLADDVAIAEAPTQSAENAQGDKDKTDDVCEEEDKSDAAGPDYGYTRPARTFAELQERELLRLYAEAGETQPYFIATDHTAKAFTFAAMAAERKSGHVDPVELSSVPLSFFELDAAERVRRNAWAAVQEWQRRTSDGEFALPSELGDALLSTNASILAANAEQSLQRFLSCVHWMEISMRNRRFVDEVGRFLYKHHRLFLQPPTGTSSGEREFSHEAFHAYEQFSRSVSEYLTAVLQHRVPGFNVEEFVFALFDTSPDEVSVAGKNVSDASESSHSFGAMNVLSFHAWRLVQAILSFEQFCALMDEFIAEEYELDESGDYRPEARSNGVVSIRALLNKSRQRRTQQQLQEYQQEQEQEQQQEAEQPPSTLSRPVDFSSLPHADVPPPARALSAADGCEGKKPPAPPATPPPPPLRAQTQTQTQIQTQTFPPPPFRASLQSSRSSVASFPRRPDAVPGRTLPPLEKVSPVPPQRQYLPNARKPGRSKSRTRTTDAGSGSNGTGGGREGAGKGKGK